MQAKRPFKKWVHMGFPKQEKQGYPSFCTCHPKLTFGGFSCPRCSSKYCEVPTQCSVCGLTLIAASHLARSYHHLFPVQPYEEVLFDGATAPASDASASVPSQRPGDREMLDTAGDSASQKATQTLNSTVCFACNALLSSPSDILVSCPRCQQKFCIDCDEYVHLYLHNCPGCTSTV